MHYFTYRYIINPIALGFNSNLMFDKLLIVLLLMLTIGKRTVFQPVFY